WQSEQGVHVLDRHDLGQVPLVVKKDDWNLLQSKILSSFQAHTAIRQELFQIIQHLKVHRGGGVLTVCHEYDGIGRSQDEMPSPSIFLLARQRPIDKFHLQVIGREFL